MGTNTLGVAVDGTVIPDTDHNSIVTALKDNFVPRDTTSKAATDIAGDLGTTSYRWKNAYVQKIVLGLIASGLSIEEDSGDIVFKRDSVEKFRIKSDGGTGLAVDSVDTDQLVDSAVETAKINALAITRAKQEAVGQQVSSGSGAYSSTSTSIVDVTNLSVTITTTGRPVFVGLVPDGTANNSVLRMNASSVTTPVGNFILDRGGAEIGNYEITTIPLLSNALTSYPVSAINTLDVVGAGTYTYKFQLVNNSSGGTSTMHVRYAKLIAYEL